MKLSDEQSAVVESPEKNLVVNAYAGTGKCLGLNTGVLMYDGSIKFVQDVVVGDILMGPDSIPRSVLQTNVGVGPLYKVTPVKGDSWVCNDEHILTLKGTNSKKGEVIDIPLKDALSAPRYKGRGPDCNWKLFRTGVNFPHSLDSLPVDPYLVGAWLGDGGIDNPIIFTPDMEILNYAKQVSVKYGIIAKIVKSAGRCPHVRLTRGGPTRKKNPLREFFTGSCVENGEKIIPQEYLTSSKENRLQLLAGLMDTDGYLSKGGYEIITKYKKLSEQYCFLSRSLGLAAYTSKKIGKIKSLNFEGEYFRVFISGHTSIIPCKVPRKKASPRKQVKDVLVTGWKAESMGIGAFYGFTLSGDGRFLLGDFTVTHNSSTIGFYAKARNSLQKLYLCFNKSVQVEATKKFREMGIENIHVTTSHSMAYQAIKPRGELVASLRISDIIKKLGDKPSTKTYQVYRHATKLLGLYCNLAEKSFDDIDYLKEVQLSSDIPDVISVARKNLTKIEGTAKKLWKSMEEGYIPITHDFYLKKYQLTNPKLRYDLILFDEAQDASPNMSQIFLSQEHAGKVAVGDSNQAIYLFRSAIDALKLSGYPILNLSQSFRFPQNIADLANQILNTKRLIDKKIPKFEIKGTPIEQLRPANGKTVYLSRSNLALLERSIELVEDHSTPFAYEGSVNSAIYTQDGVSVYDVYYLFANKPDKIRNEFIASFSSWKDLLAYVNEMEDFELKILCNLVKKYQGRVFSLIKELKAHEKPKNEVNVVFSTGHKAKGLEYEKVHVLPDFLNKEKFGNFMSEIKDVPKAKKEKKTQVFFEEINLLYVAVTRAMREVFIMGDIPTVK